MWIEENWIGMGCQKNILQEYSKNGCDKLPSFFITASKWIFGGCLNIMEEKCWQTIWRRGRMLHLLFHPPWVHLSNAQSGLPHLQEKIPFCLSLQVVFHQSKFNLSAMPEFILKIYIVLKSFQPWIWKICDLIFSLVTLLVLCIHAFIAAVYPYWPFHCWFASLHFNIFWLPFDPF